MTLRKNTSGFSLLELIVAISIAAVVLVVGVPSFRTTLDNQRMLSATNEMVMSMNLAQSEAIKRVAYVSICKSTDGATCGAAGANWNDGWIVFANATLTNLDSVGADDEIIRVNPALHESLSTSAIGTIDGFIIFRPSGTIGTAAANLTGTLTICDERGAANARGLLVDPSGHWQISRDQDHNGSALVCP